VEGMGRFVAFAGAQQQACEALAALGIEQSARRAVAGAGAAEAVLAAMRAHAGHAGVQARPRTHRYGGRDAACPFSTGEGTRRVRLVPGRRGAARQRASRCADTPARGAQAAGARALMVAAVDGAARGEIEQNGGCGPCVPSLAPSVRIGHAVPLPRTNRTHRVPPPVLTGHTVSLPPY